MFHEDHPGERVIIGLGLGNAASALFGGFGGCGLVPNTLLNGKSGGDGVASSVAYAAFLSGFILFCAPLIGKIPMAAIAGLMLNVALNTFQWESTAKALLAAQQSFQGMWDLLALLATAYVCYTVDMGLGLLIGVLIVKAPMLFREIEKGFTRLNKGYR
jgi:SulP family sulfate permease